MKRIQLILLLAGISWMFTLQPKPTLESQLMSKLGLDRLPKDATSDLAGALTPGFRAVAQSGEAFQLVAQAGAPPLFMVVDGAFAYFSTGNRFAVIDYSIDWNPRVVYTSGLLPGYVLDMEIIQGYAYLAVSPGGLRVLDVHDPYNPIPVGEYKTNATSLEPAEAGKLYVSDGTTVELWDIQDALHLAWIGSFEVKADHFTVDGDQLYTEQFYCTEAYFYKCEIYLGIYTLSDPLHANLSSVTLVPSENSEKYQRADLRNIHRRGNQLFLFGRGFIIYDIQDPGSPVLVPLDLALHPARYLLGTRIYALERGLFYLSQSYLKIFDFNDPEHPALLGSYALTFVPEWIYTDGTYAWIVDDGNRVLLLDVSDPADIRMVSTILIDQYRGDTEIAYTNEHVFLGNPFYTIPRGVQAIDVSNRALPELTQVILTPWRVTSLTAKKNLLFISEFNSQPGSSESMLQIGDASPSGEFELYSSLIFTYSLGGVTHLGEYAFFGDYQIDYSNPRHPQKHPAAMPHINYPNAYDLNNGWSVFPNQEDWILQNNLLTQKPDNACVNRETVGYALEVSGTLAIMASEDTLSLFDISQPQSPVQLGSIRYATIEDPDLELEGNRGYLRRWAGDVLNIIDLSNPFSPTLLSTLSVDYSSDLDVEGNIAYFSGMNSDCLTAYDVSDPADLQFLSSFQSPDLDAYCTGVLVDGKYAYLVQSHSAMNRNGLRILDVSNPAFPVDLGLFLPPPFSPSFWGTGNDQSIVKSGDWLAYTLENSWIFMVNVRDPFAPQTISSFYAGLLSEIRLNGKILYTRNTRRIGMWDLNDPTNPQYRGSFYAPWGSDRVPSSATQLAAKGAYVYVPCAEGIKALDASQPLPMGIISVPGWQLFGYVAVDHSLYSLATNRSSCKLFVFDIQDPLQPVLVNRDLKLNWICSPIISKLLRVGKHSLVYFSGTSNQLESIDISDPQHPVYSGAYTRPYGFFRNAIAAGPDVFTLTESGAMEVYHFLLEDGQRLFLPLARR